MINQEQHASMQSLIKRRALLILIVISLACLLIWIGVSIYFSFKKTTLPPNVQKQLSPLTPVIDTKALKELEQRKQYTPEELTGFDVIKEIIIDENSVGGKKNTTVPTPSPKSTSSATSSAQKVATSSASPSPASTKQ